MSSVKTLQDKLETKWNFESPLIMQGMVLRPEKPSEVILLLHGLNERGRRIYRKLLPYLPRNALILAPNAPFPLPVVKDDRMEYGYTWYFFDRFTKEYYIPMDIAIGALEQILKQENPLSLPLTIIGFSQGGYLAPVLAKSLPQVKKVIGIGCEFKPQLLGENFHLPLIAIHGEDDEIILPSEAKAHLKNLDFEWHLLSNTGHEINALVGEKIRSILE